MSKSYRHQTKLVGHVFTIIIGLFITAFRPATAQSPDQTDASNRASHRTYPGLVFTDLGKQYDFDADRLMVGLYHHIPRDDDVVGGNTSLRNESTTSLIWKGHPSDNGYGYFQRNRDLGQVFNVPIDTTTTFGDREYTIRSVVLRTARGNNAMMPGAAGATLYLQFFNVDPDDAAGLSINDNGTRVGDRATHGFDHQYHRADDYVDGAIYRPLVRFTGAKIPDDHPVTTRYVYDRGRGDEFGAQPGHLRYFRLTLPRPLRLPAGRRYAFMVGFERPGKKRGIGLANTSAVDDQSPARWIRDANGCITWCIRREGDGTLPPRMIAATDPPADVNVRETLVRQSTFPANHFETLVPTADGYPDIDTYRTLQFYLEP